MMDAIMGLLSGAGAPPATDVAGPTSGGPSLNELTLNPDVLPGGQPPQIPYAPGQGPNLLRTPVQFTGQGPMPALGGKDLEAALKGLPPEEQGNQLAGLAKVLKSFGSLSSSVKASPLAQRMFQEQQQRQTQLIGQQMHAENLMKFKRDDQASQLLESAGLL